MNETDETAAENDTRYDRPTAEVEIRRNQHGPVLAYTDRDEAARLLETHRGVSTTLYDLVDRRHGTDGEAAARTPA